MKTTTIEFSDEELNALVNLLDVAVRAQGLGVAQNALVLFAKCKDAAAINQGSSIEEEEPQFAEPLEAVN
tara:strand:- start:107 stop:316 length:210 start_codon:yes stop_codon:yes gene_type:complete